MAYLKDQRRETMMVEGSWNIGAYRYKGSTQLQEYVDGLKEKKLIGSLCPGCGKVIVQPRNICGRCHRRMDKRMVVSHKGTITCFVISPPIEKGKYKIIGMDPVEAGIIKEGAVLVPVFVRFDGADSNINTILLNCPPEKVHIGMRVKAVFVENPEGKLSDLEGVEPLKE